MAAALNREGTPTVAEAEAEAMAIMEGLRLAKELGFFDLVVELDSSLVVTMMRKGVFVLEWVC